MLPVILVAVGAYLIGDSVLGDKKYAKGGMAKGQPEWAVTITSEDGESYDWDGFAKDEDDALTKAEKEAGFESVESGVTMITDASGNKIEYKKGGKTQGYDDKEDERLAMEHGKISKKDLDSTHARRDDAEFEERGKMAKGGSIRTLYKQFNQEKPNILLIMIADDVASDFMREKFDKTVDWSKLSDSEKEKYNEDYRVNKTSFENYLMSEFVKLYYSDDSIKEKCKGSSHKTIDSIKSVMKDLAKKYPQDKYAKGGKLVGKQKNLDVNKNGKLDAEDFKMLRGDKMADGGMMDVVNTEVIKVKGNIMGTTSLELKIKGMRKPQDFIVYPISAEEAGKPITIQSDTRFGYLDLSSGRGLMSQSHANGAYGYHFASDKKVPFKISETDVQKIKEHLSSKASSKAGNSVIFSDNSGADKMAKGGETGQKLYYTMDNVGKAKYTVSKYDGESTHKDGSPFYDIRTFKNKVEYQKYLNQLHKEGYKERGINLQNLAS